MTMVIGEMFLYDQVLYILEFANEPISAKEIADILYENKTNKPKKPGGAVFSLMRRLIWKKKVVQINEGRKAKYRLCRENELD